MYKHVGSQVEVHEGLLVDLDIGDPNPNPNPGTKRKKPPSGDTPNSVSSVKGPQKTKRAKRASTTKEETPEDHLIAAIEG